MNRRQFLRQGCLAAAAVKSGAAGLQGAQMSSPTLRLSGPDCRAKERVCAVAEARGWRVDRGPGAHDGRDGAVLLSFHSDAGVGAEAFSLAPLRGSLRRGLVIAGGDLRGMTYGLLEIADRIECGEPIEGLLHGQGAAPEAPLNAVRGVMRLFASDVEDKGWYHDRAFWKRYFALLATERFNRFNLALGLGYDAPSNIRDAYFYFAYPFLLDVPGYQVRATNLPDSERDRNLETLRFISEEADAWGIDFQLGLWTHAYRYADSPNANHLIEGLDDRSQAPYCHDALKLLLRECPAISGVSLRIHGESGVPEGSYDFWRGIFQAAASAGRPIRLDLHAKGMDQPTLDAALATGLPVTLAPKFWAEHLGLPYHQAAIRPTELPHRAKGRGPYAQSEGARSFLRYGYGDLLREDRKYGIVFRVWPGTQRLLLWGDPQFASAYSRAMTFCGSLGCEIFDPLSFKGRQGSGLPGGRDAYADLSLRPAEGDFLKYRATYRLWGRMLYRPEGGDAARAYDRQTRRDYGAAAKPAATALAHASRILPLITTAHLPSASNNHFWPEMYFNMPIVAGRDPGPYTDTPVPKRFGTVYPLDPQLFSAIDDFAAEILADAPADKVSPLQVARWLDQLSSDAMDALAQAAKPDESASAALRRLAVDVRIQAGIGRFFAEKIRAAALYGGYLKSRDGALLDAALTRYRSARSAWAAAADAARGVYVADITWGDAPYKRGHWSDRLAQIDADLAAMEALRRPASAGASGTGGRLIAEVDRPRGLEPAPARLSGGALPRLAVQFPGGSPDADVRMYYRHVDQAEPWQSVPARRERDLWVAEVPAPYAASPYPVAFYFSCGHRLVPGFPPDLGQADAWPPYRLQKRKTGAG